ncbi:hypothetical protein M569_07672 [Genlisea aurea]|uniref:DNA topoisomerase 2 n=1 Tax=Genlisea aurea TaxID=192259 RepID=S8E477_9LAMI|nr:hypothetical protein M569_07672 [Genlisea aurea]
MAGGKKPLPDASNIAGLPYPDVAGVGGGKKTIEQTYQKKTQIEHILLRPDTYIGSIEKHTQTLWVYQNDAMVLKTINYVPGLYKIFDEILVNAADNKQRDPKMNSVKVTIDVESNCISIYNNGDGVPVEIHQDEGVYVPELIFGHLLTSSNYDDDEKKTTGGRNGYGAKLTNIFSTEFVVETADGKRQKKYKQVFSDNMATKSKPSITKCRASENWTKITFKPDLAKFSMTFLEEDVVSLMKKRVIDLAGCLGKTVKVELNGQLFNFKSFSNYCDLYLRSNAVPSNAPLPRFEEEVHERWQVCISRSEGQFQQVSFVNSIATVKGGTHVDYVTNKITSHLITVMKNKNKKNKKIDLKPHTVKNHLWVFVNALIDNPAFDSQTKETLTLRVSSFGSSWDFSSKFLDKVAKSDIMKNIEEWAEFKQKKDLKKTDGSKDRRIYGLTKLSDANEAGGRNSEKCTLILTEGDSAKALAIAGLSVVGRDHYGVFPLRGKLLNVREASHTQLMNNAEIQHIKQILGLQHGKNYDSVKSLRYGHLMIMTDQDHDGSHIKGLLINFIHSFWPSLLKVPSFMLEFITPIVKATHKITKIRKAFYTMPEYEGWKQNLGPDSRNWSIKYYKASCTDAEGKEYFEDLSKHKKDFVWVDEEDGDAIELAFSKKKIEARKNWLRQFEPGTFLSQKEKHIKYRDFVHKELILFSVADLQRSIPSMVDGLKPGQRKILFCSFKRNFVKEAKVAQFSGYVSEHSAYHHGEQSLASTIIGMAQDFVGSNNINLLLPNGQFGTRDQGGKDHASARYIYTQLSPATRYLFPKADDVLLDYLNEDGQSIEPIWYMPIIPMVLVNGSEGIGTGWSTFIPNYNPRDIIANVRHLLNDEMMDSMQPWYRGFRGSIEKNTTKEAGTGYNVSGIIEEIDETTLKVTELPIRKWTQDYKEFLESVSSENDKSKDPFIEGCSDYSSPHIPQFMVYMSAEKLLAVKQEGLLKKFKMTTNIGTTNMHLFDPKGVIKKYDTPEQILEEFYHLRLEYYEKRKKALLANLEVDLLKCENKWRFIRCVVDGSIVVSNRKRADLLLELKQKGFTPFPKKKLAAEVDVAGSTDDVYEAEENGATASHEGDYDYLLSLSIGTLTVEKMRELEAERDKLLQEFEDLKRASVKSLWMKDLDALEGKLDELEKNAEEQEKSRSKVMNNAKLKRPVLKNPRKNKEVANGKAKSAANQVTKQISDNADTFKKAEAKASASKTSDLLHVIVLTAYLQATVGDESGDEIVDRIPAYNVDSSHGVEAGTEKNDQSNGGGAVKKRKASDVVERVEKKRKKGSSSSSNTERPANANKEASSGTKKRGPSSGMQQLRGQKLITDVLQPEKKVRKLSESPFEKSNAAATTTLHLISDDDDDEEEETVKTLSSSSGRPQRASSSRKYTFSDDEDEEDEDEDEEDEEDDDDD